MNKLDTKTLQKVINSGWLRAVLLALLLIWLAQVAAQTFWLWWSGPSDKVSLTPDLVVLNAGETSREQSLDADVADRWALFGRAQVDGETGVLVASQEEGKDAPETRLKLQLLGVFAHLDSVLAGAIIQEKGKDAKLYHPGDDLPGNAKLYKVYADRVLLKRVGAIESLSFDKTALAGTISASNTTSNNDGSQHEATVEGEDSVIKQRQLVISQLALSPITEGADAGYEVTDGISTDIQQAVGLKPGDKILSVNGLSLGTEEADQQAIASFYESGQAQVEVQRGSSRLTLTYPP